MVETPIWELKVIDLQSSVLIGRKALHAESLLSCASGITLVLG